MQIYDAIMAAADQIEKRPKTFNFGISEVPRSCGSPGCALGWIGHFLGVWQAIAHGDVLTEVAIRMGLHGVRGDWLLRSGQRIFYARMGWLNGHDCATQISWGAWTGDAALCAKTLRAYAEMYHPLPKPEHTGLPDIVREIFTRRPAMEKVREYG